MSGERMLARDGFDANVALLVRKCDGNEMDVACI
jgi:hypothetical protein